MNTLRVELKRTITHTLFSPSILVCRNALNQSIQPFCWARQQSILVIII